jgi:ribonuclease Z
MEPKIVFLGTSQAIPTAKRNHVAVLLRYKGETILVDCGEGTQRQFRKAHLNPCKITKLLITHWHGDHVLGIPGLLQTLALSNYSKTLEVYGPKGTKRRFQFMLNMFVFAGKIKVKIHEVSKGKFYENDFILEAFPLKHSTKTIGYIFKEKDRVKVKKDKLRKLGLRGPIVGKIQKGKSVVVKGKRIKAKSLTYVKKGKKVAFVFDTGLCKSCYKAAKNADLAIIESTYIEKEVGRAKEYHHLTAKQAATIAKKSGVKKLYLTHLSQRYDKNPKQILKEAKKTFKNTVLAEDLMEAKF